MLLGWGLGFSVVGETGLLQEEYINATLLWLVSIVTASEDLHVVSPLKRGHSFEIVKRD